MTSEYLLDAMGLLDDDMIQDAEEGAKPAFHWQRWGAWAACLALVVALGYGASQLGAGQDGSSADTAGGIPSSSSGEAGAANSDSTATAPGENCQQGEGAIPVYRDGQTYHIVRSVEKLPEDSELLGLLERNDGASLYTDSEEYAGCEVWEDGSGFLYVQMPDGTFAQAELVQP